MQAIVPHSAQVTEITQMAVYPHQKQQATEPRITSAEEHYLIRSSHTECDTPIIIARARNPSKATSFRNKIQITRTEMEKYFHYPQRLAAQKLGVSLSTLKRRFYQLDIGR